MVLLAPQKAAVDYVYQELQADEEKIKDSVKKLKEWLAKQPHLPQALDDGRLERIFLQCKCRMEITKSVLNMYFTLRTKIPEVLSNRDPFDSWFKKLTQNVYVVTLPHYTEDFCRVTILGAINSPPDINTFDPLEIMKLAFMVQDIKYAEDYTVADIIVIDVAKGTPAHAAKFSLPFFKRLQLCALQGYKARVKMVHIVNATPLADAVLNLGMTLVKQKHRERLAIHRDGHLKGFDSLHAHISPKILPTEYGGTAGSIIDMWDEWKKKLCSYRNWFVNEGALTVDESKRPGKSIDSGELFGFEGSFRQLSVD